MNPLDGALPLFCISRQPSGSRSLRRRGARVRRPSCRDGAPDRADRRGARPRREPAAYTGFNTQTSAMQFVELAPWIPRFSINYNLGVDGISVLFILLNSFHHRAGGDCGLGVDYEARGAVHGGLPDHVGPVERRVRRPGRDAVLRILRGDADPDVPGDRNLGRTQPRLCGGEVLPLHPARVAVDAGRLSYLYDKAGGSFPSSPGTNCRWR